MTSQRIFQVLLISILALLVVSGVLTFIFFRMLGQSHRKAAASAQQAMVDPAPAKLTREAVPQPPKKRTPALHDTQLIGPSGAERKFGRKLAPPSESITNTPPPEAPPTPVPATAVPAAPPAGPQGPDAPAGPAGPASPSASVNCDEYGGPFDSLAEGAGLSVFADRQSICLDLRRPELKLQKDEKRVYTASGVQYDACLVDREVLVCMRLQDARSGGRADIGGWAGGSGPSGVSAATFSGSRLWKWHSEVSSSLYRQTAGRGPASAIPADRNNYVLGNNPQNWFTDLPAYKKVEYRDIYPGVDLTCFSDQSRMEYVFVASGNADPSAIHFSFDGGGDVRLDEMGNLVLSIQCGKVVQLPPQAYQIVDGLPQPVRSSYHLKDRRVSLDFQRIETPRAPVMSRRFDYLSYLGGRGKDQSYAIAVDGNGFVYVAGETDSPTFSSVPPAQREMRGSSDIFVTKFRASDAQVVYTTYLGGSSEDRAFGLAATDDGSVYVCGETLSTDFPTTNAVDALPPGTSWDAFLAKLDSDGRVVMSQRLGGNGDDRAFGVAVGPDGNVYVGGETTSGDFPILNGAKQPPVDGTRDGFVTRIDPIGKRVIYSTCFGGKKDDSVFAIAVDTIGAAHVAGETSSEDIPVSETCLKRIFGGGRTDAFVAKLTPQGNRVAYATYLGGSRDDRVNGIRVDVAGNIYIAGETASDDFPVTNAVQSVYGGGDRDAFMVKLFPDAAEYVYSSYYGGPGDDRAFDVAPDGIGKAYLVGTTTSPNLPMTNSFQATYGGGTSDGFVVKLDPLGHVIHSSYVGGSGDDFLYAVDTDPSGGGHVSGSTSSMNLPVINAIQSSHNGGDTDALLAKVPPEFSPGPEMQALSGGGQPGGPEYNFFMSKFEITNEEFVRFLNDAQGNANNARGTNMFFDAEGNIWLNPLMRREQDEMFRVADSRMVYHPEYPIGSRYQITPRVAPQGGSYTNHPVVGVSWYGAVKYCNWLTIDTGRGVAERCYREGTNTYDWAPTTCAPSNWIAGVFTTGERLDWLTTQGFRMPMDNAETPPRALTPFFRVSNADFARFLNDAEANPNTGKSSHMFFDPRGNVWMNPQMRTGRDEMFIVARGKIQYDPTQRAGRRYSVMNQSPVGSNDDLPVANVTWYGAMKYCNWSTLVRNPNNPAYCYREGPSEIDWAPVTCSLTNWVSGQFTDREKRTWLAVGGVRMPLQTAAARDLSDAGMDAFPATNSYPNPFNEFYKAAAWNGKSNTLYAFGRNTADQRDANYLDSGAFAQHDTTPVGFYNGSSYGGGVSTRTNENRFGIYDLSGNVSEWLTDPGKQGSLKDRAAYGGSWMSALPKVNERLYVHPYFADRFSGIRVVSTAGREEATFVVRIPYRICLCSAGTGEGCGMVKEEQKAELLKKEELGPEETIGVLEYNLPTMPQTTGIIYKEQPGAKVPEQPVTPPEPEEPQPPTPPTPPGPGPQPPVSPFFF